MKKQLLSTALLCAVTALAQAENNALDEVVVTATRGEQSINQTLQSTSVITQRDIQQSGATDVPSLLRNLAGVEVTQTGGPGSQSSLFLRGSNSTHTLVLVDGVRLGSATAGLTAIDQLMLDQVERIEVVRGNVSSLYGSEAIGGVVQIFTRRGKGAPSASVSAGYGTHATRRASAAFGGAVEGATFHVGVSKLTTDGVFAINPALAPSANPDADGYNNTSVSAQASYAFNSNHRVEVSALHSVGKVQIDQLKYDAFGSPVLDNARDENDATLSKWSLATNNRLRDNWESRVTLAQGTDDLLSRSNGLETSAYKTVSQQMAWQNTLNVGEQGVLLLAAERLKQNVSSTTLFSADTRTANSLLAGYTADYGVHQVQVNVRQDRYSDFGSANTWLLGYGLEVTDAWRMTASTSTAFKTPTFNDMHSPASWGANPNLKPEKSRNAELGLHYANAGQYLDATYFDNRIRDLIVADASWVMQNLNEARINGLELAYNGQFGNTGLKLSATRQNPRDANSGEALLKRAKVFTNLGLSQQFGALVINGEWQHSGTRNDSDINTFARTTLGAYDLVNLAAKYALDKHIELSARMDNLFNQDYMLVHGYNTPGRTFYLGLSYRQ